MPCRSSRIARVARVLGEHDVGVAQLGEHAAASRRRGSRSASRRPRAPLTPPRRDPRRRSARRRSARRPRRARPARAATSWPDGASASRSTAQARGREQLVERRDAEAAADHHARRPEDVDERADRDAEMVADRRRATGWRCSTRSCAVACGPSSSARACRRRGPEQYASTWPRPEHAPWHGSPSSTITMWPSSV